MSVIYPREDPRTTLPQLEKKIGELQKKLDSGGGILNMFYPVGSYYETSDDTFDPNVRWGGTWVKDSFYGETKKLVWTNSAPTSSFASQTIQVDISKYDEFEIVCIDYRSYQCVLPIVKVEATNGKNAITAATLGNSSQHGGNIWAGNRSIAVNTTGVWFGDGYAVSGTGTYTKRNDCCIPYTIVGVIHKHSWHRTE